MRWQAVASILFLASSNLAVSAQAPVEQKSQEDWLRYSNWEHRANSARRRPSAKTDSDLNGATPSAPADSNSAVRARTDSNAAGQSSDEGTGLPLPENPGSQTVQGAQPTIPGWAFQPPAQVQRSPELFLGNGNFGGSAAYLSPYASTYRSYHGGNSGFWPQSQYMLNSPYPLAGHSGWLGGNSSFYGSGKWGNAGKWGNLGNSAFRRSGAFALMPFAGGQNRRPLGGASEVIETGPSPASGNYFQPAASDPSASGNYYAGGAPWQVPISTPSTTKDYWGPTGSPFNK